MVFLARIVCVCLVNVCTKGLWFYEFCHFRDPVTPFGSRTLNLSPLDFLFRWAFFQISLPVSLSCWKVWSWSLFVWVARGSWVSGTFHNSDRSPPSNSQPSNCPTINIEQVLTARINESGWEPFPPCCLLQFVEVAEAIVKDKKCLENLTSKFSSTWDVSASFFDSILPYKWYTSVHDIPGTCHQCILESMYFLASSSKATFREKICVAWGVKFLTQEQPGIRHSSRKAVRQLVLNQQFAGLASPRSLILSRFWESILKLPELKSVLLTYWRSRRSIQTWMLLWIPLMRRSSWMQPMQHWLR